MITSTDGGTMVTGTEDINLFSWIALKGALRLEVAGMGRRGRSAYAIAKDRLVNEAGYPRPTSKQAALDSVIAYINEVKATRN